MLPVSQWMEKIYPQLLKYPKAPISASTVANEEPGEGYRPLECRQYPGDVLFLPSRWSHMTLNLGETIAIGGQETLLDDDR